MGCFLACFGTSKRGKRRKPAKKVLPGDHRHGIYEALQPASSLKQDSPEKTINPPSESRGKVEEQLSFNTRKKVTFDLNVKTYEDVPTHETPSSASELDEGQEKENKDGSTARSSDSLSTSEGDSITSSMGSYPSNHRYENCRNSDDEDELESEISDLDDDEIEDEEGYEEDDEDNFVERVARDESSESLFSLSVESRKRVPANEVGEKEVNSPVPLLGLPDEELKTVGPNRNVRDRSQYVHSVLNPVENLSQWKAVKARATPLLKHEMKENINLGEETEPEPEIPFSSEPSFKLSRFNSDPSSNHSKSPKQEIAVDTSLSNWLVSTETTPTTKTSTSTVENLASEKSMSKRSNSPISQEDRPILGALTVKELREMSVSSSPRRSPSRSPDDIPIVGTVGSYWNHTGQAMDSSSSSTSKCKGIPNTTSKYREDKRVNWHSTPFETRLERALNRGVAESNCS